MKKILILFIIAMVFFASCTPYKNLERQQYKIAQLEKENFEVVNNIVFWRFIYDDNENIEKLKNNPRLKFETDTTGYIIRTNFNDKKLNDFTGQFKIEKKDTRYRASVFNVVFYVEPITIGGGGIAMQSITEYTIEQSLINKDGAVRSYNAYDLTGILNPHLIELFTAKEFDKEDDW
jgi:hypothetical protein